MQYTITGWKYQEYSKGLCKRIRKNEMHKKGGWEEDGMEEKM